MLHRTSSELTGVPPSSMFRAGEVAPKVVLAVAPPPRVDNPAHWGWPHWLAPVYRAGGHHRPHRTSRGVPMNGDVPL